MPLSFTGKRWLLADDATGIRPASEIGTWIAGRRALTADAARTFDPSVFPDAAKAAERVKAACTKRETIAIFGDYDCDGISSAAMLVRALRRRGNEPLTILPHRGRDGYGLKSWVIERCRQAGVTLLLVADNGILSLDAVREGNAAGIDTIILDHHHLPPDLPPAFAILHPQLSSLPEPYPSAAGVVFLFLHALEGDDWRDRDEDLALAAIGTVADLVPLAGFNRMLVQAGTEAMRRRMTGPVAELVKACGCMGTVTSGDIAFRLAPRINAAGRMDDPSIALRVLLEGGEGILHLESLNADRQKRTAECLDSLRGADDAEAEQELPAFLFHADTGYPPGIVGLLAGKLTEHWGRPSLVASVQGELCTASLRSIPAYHVTEALARHASLLTTFGGHAQAAGCTFPLSNIDALRAALEEDARSRLTPEQLHPTLSLETELALPSISLPLIRDLRRLEPFGQGNPDPLFLLRAITLENIRAVGAEGRHLQAEIAGRKLIGFGLGGFSEEVTRRPIDLAFSLAIDAWKGFERPQLIVRDVRAA